MERDLVTDNLLKLSRGMWGFFMGMQLLALAVGWGLVSLFTPESLPLNAQMNGIMGVVIALIGLALCVRGPVFSPPADAKPESVLFTHFLLSRSFFAAASIMGAVAMFYGGGELIYWFWCGGAGLVFMVITFPTRTGLARGAERVFGGPAGDSAPAAMV